MRLLRSVLPILGLLTISTTSLSAAGISATASYTINQLSANSYQYNVTLNNTGTTTIGTFWLGWIPGAGFLSAIPTNVVNPAGWTSTLTDSGAAIRWVTSSALLAAGSSLPGFQFTSSETPAQLLGTVPSGPGAGLPATTSFVYIGAAFGDSGSQFAVTQATPEPATFGLAALAIGAGFAARRSRKSQLS